MPRARTATTAIERSRIGGISHALAISQAETPASARALPSASTPNDTASASRDRRGRSSARPAARGRVLELALDKDVASDLDHLVADVADLVAVADYQHRCAVTGDLPDRAEDVGLPRCV